MMNAKRKPGRPAGRLRASPLPAAVVPDTPEEPRMEPTVAPDVAPKSFKFERVPMDDYRSPLAVLHQEPGYEYRVFNQGPGWEGRVERAKLAGWEPDQKGALAPVGPGLGTSLGSAAATPVGGGVEGVLMRIKSEWFAEDAARREVRNKEIEASLNNSGTGTPYGDGARVNTSLGRFHDSE